MGAAVAGIMRGMKRRRQRAGEPIPGPGFMARR
jgi:hypothetical protein